MSRTVWTPHAERELDDILFWISVRDGRPATGVHVDHEIRRMADDFAQPDAARQVHPVAPPGWFYCRHTR